VDFCEARELSECSSELSVDTFGAVTHHVEATAALGTFGAEGGNHDVASRLEGLAHGSYIPDARLLIAKEVKHRAIMPEIEFMKGKLNPSDVSG
jgi:hypothetical protein